MNREDLRGFTHRVLIIVGIVTVVVLALLLSWQAVNVLLLIFAGILFAVFLNGSSQWITDHTPIPYKVSLVLVVVGLLLVVIVGGWLAAPSLAQQARDLSDSLIASLQSLRDSLAETEWGQTVLEQTPGINEIISNPQEMLANVMNIFATTMNAVTGLIVIFFVGVYFAFEPDLYVNGLVQLVPFQRRKRAREVLAALGHTLRHWLMGRFVAMLVVGAMAVAGLSLIGIPLAFILGLLSGVLDFIPFIGPLLAIVPALILAATDGSQQLLYVGLLFLGIQTVEGYFLTPLVERKAVSLPFAMTIIAQVFFGLLAGTLGVALASPLAAATMILVKMLYVEDVLGDHDVELPEEAEAETNETTETDRLYQPPPLRGDGTRTKEQNIRTENIRS